MKKLIAVLAVALLPTLASAEELKVGTIQLSGASKLSFDSSTFKFNGAKQDETTTFSFETGGLYYLTPMIGVGAELSYQKQTDKPVGGTETTLTLTGIGPKVGLDVPLTDGLAAFGDLSVVYENADFEGSKASGWGLSVAGGVKYFPASAVSLDLGLRYTMISVTSDATPSAKQETSSFGIVAGLSVYFGGAH